LERESGGGRLRKEGFRKSDTTSRSRIRERIGKIDIGRMSDRTSGEEIFGIGCMTAIFHCAGMVEFAIDKLKRCANGSQNIGAPRRKNQKKRLSEPGVVGLSLSRILKIL
jgi:hypothetical protein